MALGEAIPGYRKHSDRKKSILRPLKRFRGATLLRCVDARIAVSRFVAASVVDAEFYPLERIEVVPNGVDVGRFAAADPMALRWELGLGSRSMVACVSRVSHEKGVHILIQAFSTLPGDVVLVIAGDGPNTDYCKRLVAALGLADRVYFLGLRNDVENIYAAADLIAMPSLCDEAFGLSAVEAMAAGKPLVATNAGAMPEILADGECGELVPRNDETALATAISSLLANPARAKSLGEAARKRALENYPIEKWVDGVIGAYSRLVPAIHPSSTVFSFQGGSAETENAPATPRNETATPPAHDAVG
jgi:glycosyltransferase involved in cell wall biosynthesis